MYMMILKKKKKKKKCKHYFMKRLSYIYSLKSCVNFGSFTIFTCGALDIDFDILLDIQSNIEVTSWYL